MKSSGEQRSLVILKTGSTLPELSARRGDFEDWTRAGIAGSSAAEGAVVLDIENGADLPDPDALSGLIITGSHTMVTERQPWSERAAAWLPGVVERGIPVLGICYGHQLLAHALGGRVENNPNGREFGTVTIELLPEAGEDDLLGGLDASGDPVRVQVCHTQSVLRLPGPAHRLACSARDGIQAFRVGERAWGVQFHPEFDADVVRTYIRHYWPLLEQEGQDADFLSATTQDTPYGRQIFQRFMTVVEKTYASMA
jgi:GMP synthase (glutamine-hydrolysing)